MRETEREQGNGGMRETERGIDREGEGTGGIDREGNRPRGRGNREQGNGRGEWNYKFNLILVKSGEGSFEGLWVFSCLIAGLCRLSR